MHSTSKFVLVIVVTLICTDLPSRVEPKTTMKSLPTARHGSINNLTLSVMNGNINPSDVINGRNNNLEAKNRRANNHNRIVGGHIAQKNQFPFLVSIFKIHTYSCGGTLLRADWVLTALHCLRDHKNLEVPKILPIYFTVFAGHTDLKKVKFYDIKPENPEMRDVHETFPYEKFVKVSLGGDIGLMRLVSSFNLGKSIQLAPLDPQGITKEYYEEQWIPCTVAGWGTTVDWTGAKQQDSALRPLRYADVMTISTYRCRENWRVLNKYVPISNKFHICAQGRWAGSCFGDSGGPLLCGFYQVGVVSFGESCMLTPTVFTRIAYFRNWINETMDLHKNVVISKHVRSASASSTRIHTDACVLGIAIIVMQCSFNGLC